MEKEKRPRGGRQILRLWHRSDEYRRLLSALQKGEGPGSAVGVFDASAVHIVSALLEEVNGSPALVLLHSEDEARRIAEEMSQLMEGVLFFPAREIQLAAFLSAGRELASRRVSVLSALIDGTARAVVCSVEAAMQAMAPPDVFFSAETALEVGGVCPPDELAARLSAAGYERVERIEGEGQFRFGGGIVDVYIPGSDAPCRIEFFDDEIDSLRRFGVSTQRSIEKLDALHIPPATECPLTREAAQRAAQLLVAEKKRAEKHQIDRIDDLLADIDKQLGIEGGEQLIPYFYEPHSLFDYLQGDSACMVLESRRIEEAAASVHHDFLERYTMTLEDGHALKQQERLMLSPAQWWKALDRPRTFYFAGLSRVSREIRPKILFQFALRSASQYSARLDAMVVDLESLQKNTSVLLCAGKHADRVEEAFRHSELTAGRARTLGRQPAPGEILILEEEVLRGYESTDMHLLLLGEMDLFGQRKRPVKSQKRQSTNRMDLFAELKIGDYVVHERYGIGQFKGIETHTGGGVQRDFLVIQYAGNDRVGVSTDELDRVQKYIGSSDRTPRVSKLGGGEWKKAVGKAKASVKKLAFDLVRLYAEREKRRGFAFSSDTLWQQELEDAFPYEETEGQMQALIEIKGDMESPRVMDRLLCGDVGYGKTEVALRAAFKATQDSKQVAFLVPTTILAQQHYMTLKKRFEGFPIEVEALSRLRTAKEQKEILKRAKDGRVDVLIGTHRLLGKDVEFKDLGLLIVDEEQRFGVGHKEQIKERKKDIDVLSLSATPIPRTLHMSLSGIRDMSVIDTPPEDRYPVQTYVMEYADEVIREAIRREIAHGGQVYFLYNNVADMDLMLRYLQELVPEVRAAMAHGQMPQGHLEKVMLAFMEREYDLLICSTIIESGLDIANVNTIIVYDADHYGVSQLYQLRGRVGRSNRMAYAYLTVRPNKVLSEVAEKRLRALREFTEFGSGFKIAMRDLEIRGAGDLLGAQQHGHMDDVGYDYYVRLLEEAMQEARGESVEIKVDAKMDIAIDAHIPHAYISDEAQRLELYKRIASVETSEEYGDVLEELIDRFGDPPQSVTNLLDISLLKAEAEGAGIDRVTVRAGEAKLRFAPHSRLSGTDLLAILQSNRRLKLLPGATSVVEWKHPGEDSSAVVHRIAPVIAEMFACATGSGRV